MGNEIQSPMTPRIARTLGLVGMIMLGATSHSLAGELLKLGTAPSDPIKAGFILDVSSPRLGGDGLQPLVLNFRPIGKRFNRQRRLRIQFRPRADYATKLDYQYSQDVVVPQDATDHTVSVLVPHFYRWQSCAVSVFENGRRWGKAPLNLAMSSLTQDWGQHVSVGIIRPKGGFEKGKPWSQTPDVRSLVTILGSGPINDNVKPRLNNQESLTFIDNLNTGFVRFRLLGEDELPASWMGHSQLDVIMVPLPVLVQIEKEQPEQYKAIEDWVTTGGHLWIHAAAELVAQSNAAANTGTSANTGTPIQSIIMGPRPNKQRKIPLLPNLKRSMRLEAANETGPIEYQPWGMGSFYANNYNNSGNEPKRKTVFEKLVQAKHPAVADPSQKVLMSKLDVIHHGMGRVVLLDDEDPFPGSFKLWQALKSDWQDWNLRHGVNYSNGNESYWAWLMATVGQPPVTMFLILNGLFVIIMGPVLYFMLRKRGRLYLLYFLVPAMAAITTLGLFGYAFISDGFSNRARVRQLTWIDGRQEINGKSPVLNESRQTYYTVVDNRRGLLFDQNALVLPVLYSEMLNNYRYYPADASRSGDYLIEETKAGRRFYGDFLPVRTQKHYLVTQPDRRAFPIQYQFIDGKAVLTHNLDTPLTEIVIIDPDDGKRWMAKDVPSGQEVVMQPAKVDDMNKMTYGIIEPDSETMPKPYQRRFSLTDETYLESFFKEIAGDQPKGAFMAKTTVSADQFALPDCQQEQCVRVIGGRLP